MTPVLEETYQSDLADEIEDMLTRPSDHDNIARVSLGEDVHTVTVVVDGSTCWPLIADLIMEGRTEQQIIMSLQMWCYVLHGGAPWTPAAVEEIYQRGLDESWS